MSNKITYNSLKLKTNTNVNTFTFNDALITVKQYLPIEEKNDLIQITLQKAAEDGIYNDLLLDMYFNLNIIYSYTNLSFTEKQREDEAKLYDQLQSNGLILKVIENMTEYEELLSYLKNIIKDKLQYSTTAAAAIYHFSNELPKNMEAAANMINSFDADKFKNVKDMIDMAKSTGMDNDRR